MPERNQNFQSRQLPHHHHPQVTELSLPRTPASEEARSGERRSFLLTEVHGKLRERFAPPPVIVEGDYRIVHLSEGAGRYLRLG